MLPETFLRDMLYCLTSEASTTGDQLRLQHYTPMLHCALLAYGSAFSDNPEIRSPSSRAEFGRYAKQWLDYEFERPVMALVRALALLAEYHCGIGERSIGFMYMDASIPASEQPKDVHLSATCQWNRYLPQVPQLTRLEHDTILSRCFKYGVTWLHCMLPETFLRDMLYCLTSEASTTGDQLRLQHYTPMLHCALLAYGSAFSDNPEIRSPSSRAEFGRYAKQWLDYEFERPVMALVPQLTRLEHDTILSRCFKYGVTWLHCMLPETFLRDMLYCLTSEASTTGDQLRLQHYTPMLHCALLAYGSAFSDNPEIRSPSSRAEFGRYAKQWLDYEFERPVMALVRALALLAEYHCGIGERSIGFMYMGMSIRAARSLILTDEHDPWLNEGVTAHSEAAERDWHFWSAFSQDKIMALEFRQEYDVPIPHLGVSLPSIDTESDGQPWSDALVGFPPRLTTKTFFDSCKLMVISTRVISFLIQETHGERAVINLHLQLDTWFNNLPRELLVWARSSSPLPHIITLHICYWFLLVCLHKPFYGRATLADDHRAKASNTPNETSGQGGSDPIHDLSMKMVDRATHKIVQLLQMFEEQHGMRFFPRNMIHVIYECGVVLLKEAAVVPFAATKKRATALEAGNVCLRVLKGTSRTWPWAEQLANRLEARLNEAGANM
ncbi:unnamed protein product [Rhizoctonia solani]|uniref:Xylanolytic transcriptional activator regulatory domain-containing protein n=1 Tax=Rhizoctonia solani TaxID=456999 RepID=A0A8H3GJG2_9AGAM|nr:unnamed protein product [Rhizoctonia solani]